MEDNIARHIFTNPYTHNINLSEHWLVEHGFFLIGWYCCGMETYETWATPYHYLKPRYVYAKSVNGEYTCLKRNTMVETLESRVTKNPMRVGDYFRDD